MLLGMAIPMTSLTYVRQMHLLHFTRAELSIDARVLRVPSLDKNLATKLLHRTVDLSMYRPTVVYCTCICIDTCISKSISETATNI